MRKCKPGIKPQGDNPGFDAYAFVHDVAAVIKPPAPCGGDDARVTVYSVFGKRALLAIASWCDCDSAKHSATDNVYTSVILEIDWAALGLVPERTNATIPDVAGLQKFAQLNASQLGEIGVRLRGVAGDSNGNGGLVVELNGS